ncbi:MAG: phosphomannomutase [Nitrosopumilaceae archaeon]|nr:phosphomannomutase [Nitrosopumilaceae archaeon]
MKKTISGIRGIVGGDIGIKDVIKFCGNFAGLSGGRCVTGRDTRPSGPMMERAAHAGLMEGGVDVYDMGVAPTPVVFREARRIGAGVVITSSHNPLVWNGLKFVIGGRGINESELPLITGTRSRGDGVQEGGSGDAAAAAAASTSTTTTAAAATEPGVRRSHASSYVEEAAEVIGEIGGSPRIAVDVGGGAAAHVAPRLYEKIGCGVSVINSEPRSRGPDPTTDGLDGLVSLSRAKGSIGFAFDLDGDRLVIVADGAKQTPDATLGLGIAGALDMGYERFVLSADTSRGVERLIESHGGAHTRAKVGEANVVEEMIKGGAQAGGEGSSGGFILPEFNHCRDGILAGGVIARMLQEDGGARFREVLGMLGRYHIVRTKIPAGAGLRQRDMVERALRWLESECSEVQRLDGVRGVIDDDSWVLVRESNTEDAVRLSAESDDAARCEAVIRNVRRVMAGG